MSKFYSMEIAGCKRDLPICSVSDKLDIAAFIMLGDVEITEASAKALAKRLPEGDTIVTAECKGIPLAHELAKLLNMRYVVARKKTKLYMQNVIDVEVQSITTEGVQHLYLDGNEADKYIKGKRVLIVDDVISTGESLAALEKLVNTAEGNIVAKAAVLAEGDAADRKDIVYLEKLPLFFKD